MAQAATTMTDDIHQEEIRQGENTDGGRKGISTMKYIVGVEAFEKAATVESTASLNLYLIMAFYMKTTTANALLSVFNSTCNVAVLAGALLGDAYFGHFSVVACSCVFSFLGLVLLGLTSIPALHPNCPQDLDHASCQATTAGQSLFLLLCFGLLVIGSGGIRSCTVAFGADQLDSETESERKAVSNFHKRYKFTVKAVVMVSGTVFGWAQTAKSWFFGLLAPVLLLLCSILIFLWVDTKASFSSPSLEEVLCPAWCKYSLLLSERGDWSFQQQQSTDHLFDFFPAGLDINSKLPRTTQFRFLDKAAIATPHDELNQDGSPKEPWSLCSIQQVEEVKILLRLLPVWATFVPFQLAISQLRSYVAIQALQSDTKLLGSNFEIPAPFHDVFFKLAAAIWIPIYAKLLVPAAQRITRKEGGITVLQRVGTGLFLGVVSLVVAGLIEEKRKRMDSSMGSLWLIPQIAVAGVANKMALVGLVIFSEQEFPERMKVVAWWAPLFLARGLGYSFAGLLVSGVHKGGGDWLPDDLNQGKLDYYFYLIAGLLLMNFGCFIYCAGKYKYRCQVEVKQEGATDVAE
ncbi:unnamed protein product [Linum trigynum]|uniref:Uncharacterized protein n=1 Tax=Linum trigynum TaxID=586398 RepID=A0AAV2F1G0_9ROSI